MKNVLISHEVPIDFLERSKAFNDYDYCLLHLTYQYPEYKNFYKQSKRKVLLDNSIFELGESLTDDQLAEGVLEIKPTWYVVPDCLHDAQATIQRFKNFQQKYEDLPGLAIGAIQGKSREELIECYKFMSEHADKIAIPFASKAFNEYFNAPADDKFAVLFTQYVGRQFFIRELISKNLWNYNKPHHLLGCSLAREFSSPIYVDLNIESVDTSNPIVSAIEGLKYTENYGLDCKPSVLLCDLIAHKIPEKSDLEKLMLYNVEQFRKICYKEK